MFLTNKKQIKRVSNIFKVAIAFFIMLNMLNSYVVVAADPVDSDSTSSQVIDMTKVYQEENDKNSNWFDMLVSAARNNISKQVLNIIIGTLGVPAQAVIPSKFVKLSEPVRSELDNSTYNKSLFEFAGENVEYAMNNQMTVNIPSNLAMDWVPGYADNGGNSVYAGNGYDYLKATNISDIWDYSRQISYILDIVIIIGAGFMIMFRNKIGGQMAVTVYNTLPNVILGLILVTFSFSIVGIILNFSAVLTTLAHSILNVNATTAFYPTEFFSSMSYMVTGLVPKSGDVAVLEGIMIAIGGVLTALSGGLGALLFLFVAIIIFITYIIAFWNVWFTLFKAYLSIVLDTVAGPIILTLAVFPGNSKYMIGWFNRLFRNALIFPIIFFIMNATLKIIVDMNLDLTGLGNGTLDTTVSSTSTALGMIMQAFFKLMLPLGALYFCANVPKILEELFPSQGSQGMTAAIQGTQQGFAKIPLFGSLFAGK